MNKRKYFLILIIFIFFSNPLFGDRILIKAKVKNEIVTNIDIEKEINYLVFLNPKLKELNAIRLNRLAKDSLINEIIKKKELERFFDFEKENKLIDIIENNLIKNKKIKNKSQFKAILESNNLKYEMIREKLKVEAYWNQLIYDKYSKNLKIDKNELKEKILNNLKNKKKRFEYNLSEILYTSTNNESHDSILKKINQNLEKIGFENTANIFSISNSSKNGGLIGWINELQLSSKVRNEINKLEIGQVSKPIKIQNGYLLIKINDKKEFKENINIEDQLTKLANKEKNRQLNTFSNIFYKRLKKNIEINEY